jgi:hypothetical protein
MKLSCLPALVCLTVLAGCQDKAAPISGPTVPGRYAGVGVYDAGHLWHAIENAPEPADSDAARVTDDEHVIVVVDSHSGEIRQCGDHSGYCVTINPWTNSGHVPGLPSRLGAHGAEREPADAPSDSK